MAEKNTRYIMVDKYLNENYDKNIKEGYRNIDIIRFMSEELGITRPDAYAGLKYWKNKLDDMNFGDESELTLGDITQMNSEFKAAHVEENAEKKLAEIKKIPIEKLKEELNNNKSEDDKMETSVVTNNVKSKEEEGLTKEDVSSINIGLISGSISLGRYTITPGGINVTIPKRKDPDGNWVLSEEIYWTSKEKWEKFKAEVDALFNVKETLEIKYSEPKPAVSAFNNSNNSNRYKR